MEEQKTQKKIYLSGKISGDPDFKRKFEEKARELTELGYQVFNPAVHPDIFTWEQFMELDLLALSHCDSIYLLDDWKDSRGAQMEYDQALRLGKEIMFDSEHKVSVENKIKSEVTTLFSYKFRVELENGKMSPWQFSDKKPEPEDLKDVKNYYDDLNKRKDEQQIKQENPEHNNPERIGNIETVEFVNDEPAQVSSSPAPGDEPVKNTEQKKYFWMTFGRDRDLIRYSNDNNGMNDAKPFSYDEALNNLMANHYEKKIAVKCLDTVIDNENAGYKDAVVYANHALTPEEHKALSEMTDKNKLPDYDELEKRLVEKMTRNILDSKWQRGDVEAISKFRTVNNWPVKIMGRFKLDFNKIFKKEEGFEESDKKKFADYLMKKYKGKKGLITHLSSVVKDNIIRGKTRDGDMPSADKKKKTRADGLGR